MSHAPPDEQRTLKQLAESPLELVKQVRQSGRPLVVTSQGKTAVVLLDGATFERYRKTANLAALLAPAEAEVRAGKTRPAKAALKELRRAETA